MTIAVFLSLVVCGSSIRTALDSRSRMQVQWSALNTTVLTMQGGPQSSTLVSDDSQAEAPPGFDQPLSFIIHLDFTFELLVDLAGSTDWPALRATSPAFRTLIPQEEIDSFALAAQSWRENHPRAVGHFVFSQWGRWLVDVDGYRATGQGLDIHTHETAQPVIDLAGGDRGQGRTLNATSKRKTEGKEFRQKVFASDGTHMSHGLLLNVRQAAPGVPAEFSTFSVKPNLPSPDGRLVIAQLDLHRYQHLGPTQSPCQLLFFQDDRWALVTLSDRDKVEVKMEGPRWILVHRLEGYERVQVGLITQTADGIDDNDIIGMIMTPGTVNGSALQKLNHLAGELRRKADDNRFVWLHIVAHANGRAQQIESAGSWMLDWMGMARQTQQRPAIRRSRRLV